MLIPSKEEMNLSAYIPSTIGLMQNGKKHKYGSYLCSFLSAGIMLTGFADVASAMAPPAGGAGGSQDIGAMVQSFLPLILIFVIFYFLLIRPQSKKAKEHKGVLENLKKGDKIMTNGGIHGIIDDIDAETITLKVGIGADVKIKVNRNYVAGLRAKE